MCHHIEDVEESLEEEQDAGRAEDEDELEAVLGTA